jgi:hypothetical protein
MCTSLALAGAASGCAAGGALGAMMPVSFGALSRRAPAAEHTDRISSADPAPTPPELALEAEAEAEDVASSWAPFECVVAGGEPQVMYAFTPQGAQEACVASNDVEPGPDACSCAPQRVATASP